MLPAELPVNVLWAIESCAGGDRSPRPGPSAPVAALFEKVDPMTVSVARRGVADRSGGTGRSIARERGVLHRERARVLDGAALAARVVRQGRAGDGCRAAVVDGTTLRRRVARERGIIDHEAGRRLVLDAAADSVADCP